MSTPTTRRDRYVLPGNGPTDEDLRHEVELTRAELAGTVDRLRHKVDIKARMREAAQHRMALWHDALGAAAGHAHDLAHVAKNNRVAAVGLTGGLAALIVLGLAASRH